MDPRKDSVLEKEAAIFQKRDDEQFRGDKKKELTKEEKMVIFKQYYLWKVIVAAVVVIIIAAAVINAILNPSPESKLNIAFLNNTYNAEIIDKSQDEAIEYLSLDKEKETVTFDYYGNTTISSETQVKFTTFYTAGDIDYIVEDVDTYNKDVVEGMYYPLDDWITNDMKEYFGDRVLYGKDDKGVEHAYGIKFYKDSAWYKNMEGTDDEVILCVAGSSNNIETVKKYFPIFYEKEIENK